MYSKHVIFFVPGVQEKRSLPGEREPAVKRAFKSFVEERDDKYTMELLLLPSALKEELLGLAQSPSSAHPGSSLVGVILELHGTVSWGLRRYFPNHSYLVLKVILLSSCLLFLFSGPYPGVCQSGATCQPGGCRAGPLSEQHTCDGALQPHPGHQL